MALFPHLQTESTVQVNDKTRLNASKSFGSAGGSISKIEIDPDGSGFIDVTADQYLDWQYSTTGNKTATVRLNDVDTATRTINILSIVEDKLFSSDDELIAHEPDVLNWVRDGRNTFLDIHRRSQEIIIAWLDEHRIWDTSGNRLTKDDVIDIEEVNEWSKYQTLALIFEGLSNAVDDIFAQKASRYRELRDGARNRAALRLDRNGDGETDSVKYDKFSTLLRRR